MPNARIIIIEPHGGAAERLSQLLRAHGYDIISSLSSHDGLRAAKESAPDLVLIDEECSRTPEGLDVRILIEQAHGRSIPVIFLQPPSVVGSEAPDYLQKPYFEEELLSNIEHLLAVNGKVRMQEAG